MGLAMRYPTRITVSLAKDRFEDTIGLRSFGSKRDLPGRKKSGKTKGLWFFWGTLSHKDGVIRWAISLPAKVANRGISGDTTRGVLIRMEEDVLSLNPSGVVLLIGTNDLEEGSAGRDCLEPGIDYCQIEGAQGIDADHSLQGIPKC